VLQHLSGATADLHERSAQALAGLGSSAPAARSAFVMEPVDRALVLGSSQPAGIADAKACAREGVRIVRRRSGGGVVLVEPGGQLWVDLLVPAGDALWEPDVGRAAWWVGEAWARALASVGLSGAAVWKGAFARRPGGDLSCFATLGAGEVTWSPEERPAPGGAVATLDSVDPALASSFGRTKLVGIAQRRTKFGTLFQCSCLLRWEPERLVSLLRLSARERRTAVRDLAGVATGVPAEPSELLSALMGSLPAGASRPRAGTCGTGLDV